VTVTSTKTPTIVHYKNVKVKIKKPECLSKANYTNIRFVHLLFI